MWLPACVLLPGQPGGKTDYTIINDFHNPYTESGEYRESPERQPGGKTDYVISTLNQVIERKFTDISPGILVIESP